MKKITLRPGDALLIVDPQNDFFPTGALPVPEGDKIIPTVNAWIEAAEASHRPIFVSRDWHPANHCSFKTRGGPWPVHCVQHTPGAAFHSALRLPRDAVVFSKASSPEKDAYSAFEGISEKGTALLDALRAAQVKRVWVCGLALDYCVRASALDAHRHGFDTRVILEATRPVAADTGVRTLTELGQTGILLVGDRHPTHH